jgi:hypothetical protein
MIFLLYSIVNGQARSVFENGVCRFERRGCDEGVERPARIVHGHSPFVDVFGRPVKL